MSDNPASQSGGPLGDLLRDLARLLTAQGPINWEVARQLALWVATEGHPEPNPDPLARIRTEELLRVAEMHVAEASSMATSRRGWLSVRSVTRAEWASTTLTSLKEVLTRLASSLAAGQAPAQEAEPGPMDQLLGNLPQVIGPLMIGAQAGTMVGHLASRSMGQYDMPLPPPANDELLAVPAVVDAFAAEWGLSTDDVRMYVCLRDAAFHAVLVRPHVTEVLRDHMLAYAAGFQVQMGSIEERLSGLDPTDPASFQRALGDPEAMLGDVQSDEQRRLLVPFRAFLSALSGYTDYVTGKVGQRLVGAYPLVNEAFRRRRVEDGPGQRVLGKLLGIEVDQAVIDAGHAFVNGVLERAGEEGLARLWGSVRTLPTPAEVEAPGLWLARIEFAG
ncbi:MAG TPA: zinc-dependent metalloprotease [Acidimicrobiales bacterium]|nr:zinc-dependent metalloprotease [Acidimicrobiales bacterium]